MTTATIGKPTPVILSDDLDLSLFEWFGKDEGGHLVVLMFAWAYTLSARWAEIAPRASPIEYTANEASWIPDSGDDRQSIVVELG